MNWIDAYYKQLNGATVLDAGTVNFEGQRLPVLSVRLRNKKIVHLAIYADPEGNGPGHIEGLPRPKI